MSKKNERLLNAKQVAAKCGFGVSSIYKWMNGGTFPIGVKIQKCRRWPESDIDDWIASLSQ